MMFLVWLKRKVNMKNRFFALILCAVLLISILPSSVFAAEEEYDEFTYLVIDDKAEITRYTGNAVNVSIPETLGGYPVTSIGFDAFYGCYNIISIHVPSGVTVIAGHASDDCYNLASIEVDSDNLYYSSSDGVLFAKNKEILVRYPQAKSEHTYVIPDGVHIIADRAFAYCENLRDVIIADTVSDIEDQAFYACTRLADITIPDSVEHVYGAAFTNCWSLVSIDVERDNPYYSSQDGVLFNKTKTMLLKYPEGNGRNTYVIPDGVTFIGIFAFFDCDNLVKLTIPNSVKEIGRYVFDACDELTEIYYTGMESEWLEIVNESYDEIELQKVKIHFDVNVAAEYAEQLEMQEAPAEEVEEEGLSETATVYVYMRDIDGLNDIESATSYTKGVGTDFEATAEKMLNGEYEFLYWEKGLGTERKIVSDITSCTVKVQSEATHLTAVYRNIESKKTVVVFLNSNGDEITKDLTESGSALNAPSAPTAPGAPEFFGWKMPGDSKTYSAEEVNELKATGGKMVFVAQFAPAEEKADITVTENGVAHTGKYHYGQSVSVTAEEKSGTKTFAYWKKGDEVVSFDKTYTFKAWESCTLTAVYLDTVSDVGALRKIIIKGNVAEFIGLDTGVEEKGIIFRDTDSTPVTLGNATHKIVMAGDGNHLSFNNDLEGWGRRNYTGYAILSNGNVIYDK